jgi:hypothetical protein
LAVEAISRKTPGIVNYDVDVTADGNTLTFVDTDERLLYFHRQDGELHKERYHLYAVPIPQNPVGARN